MKAFPRVGTEVVATDAFGEAHCATVVPRPIGNPQGIFPKVWLQFSDGAVIPWPIEFIEEQS